MFLRRFFEMVQFFTGGASIMLHKGGQPLIAVFLVNAESDPVTGLIAPWGTREIHNCGSRDRGRKGYPIGITK